MQQSKRSFSERTTVSSTAYISLSYMLGLLDFAERCGVMREQLFELTNIPSVSASLTGDHRVSAVDFFAVADAMYLLLDQDDIGLEIIANAQPTHHGYLGYALLTSATLGDVVTLALKFLKLRVSYVSAKTHIEQSDTGEAILVATIDFDVVFGRYRIFHIEGMMFQIAKAACLLAGNTPLDIAVCMDYPEPVYFARWKDRLSKTSFGHQQLQIKIPVAQLSIANPMAEPVAHAQAVAQCERELDALQLAISAMTLTDKVRLAFATEYQDTYPSLPLMAAYLHLSERTLHRKLAQEGTTFLTLLNEVRCQRASVFLANNQLSIEQISQRLGFLDVSNFSRAFKKWTGMTPKQARDASLHN